MKFYIIAGEASGDMHAANLVKALKQLQPGAQFRGLGGDRMKNSGVELIKHYRETAFMGFLEVIMNLKKILGYIEECKRDILEWNPDAIILVDYPGFNLRIAGFAHQKKISGNGFRWKIFYYISPQVWAWKASRVKKIKRDVDRMFVILPFEKEFYKKWNYEVDFVGHPLLDEINLQQSAISSNQEKKLNKEEEEKNSNPIIALLPGSRRQEIAKMLPVMMDIVDDFPDHQFIVAAVNAIDESFYRSLIGNRKCKLVFERTYFLLSKARAALVTSGTATLETALFNVPEVVCYKGSAFSYFIARRLVDVKYISLVNLILDRQLVKELIQRELNRTNLKSELQKVLFDESSRKEIEKGYEELRQKLGYKGASQKAAMLILEMMNATI